VANTTTLFPTRRSFPPCTFPTRRETRLTLRNKKSTMRPSTVCTMENAKNSGQVEGWNELLDKFAAVLAGLAQGL